MKTLVLNFIGFFFLVSWLIQPTGASHIGMMISARDLAVFHTTERVLYSRLVKKLGIYDGPLAYAVIALWLWMESIGYYGLISKIIKLHDQALLKVAEEGRACLDILYPGRPAPTAANDIPVISSLLTDHVNLSFLHCNKGLAINGVSHFVDTVCSTVFNENVMKLFEENTPSTSESTRTTPVPQPVPTNSYEPTWLDHLDDHLEQPNSVDEVNRSMFLTFSKGHPITPEEIYNFFNWLFGDCVESVMVEQTPPGCDPQYGRLVLKKDSLIPIILNGEEITSFMVNGKKLSVRRLIPTKTEEN